MSNFTPCVWVLTERQVADQIFIAAALGEDYFRLISLPRDITKLPGGLEVQLVGLIARSHYRRHNGVIGCFGGILSYTYLRSPTERWTFSTHGHLVSRNAEPIYKGKYSLHLKGTNRDISFLFRRRLDSGNNG